MPSETQTDFSGGINTRLPPHKIDPNQATELQNIDLSFGDLRGEYGVSTDGRQEFFYEAGDAWISAVGFSGATTIITWPYGSSYSFPPNTVTISSNSNFFSGSPNAVIKDGLTITIADGVTVTIYETTQGVHGANSYVEYNDDLYISRSSFPITGTISGGSLNQLNPGNDLYKLQVGDEISHANIIAGTFITEIDIATNIVTLSDFATASVTSGTFTVNAIISKYIDGNTEVSFRAGVNKPIPVFSIGQVSTYNPASSGTPLRNGFHSESWYGASDPIPFQYGIAAYDASGVESTISELTDVSIGIVGNNTFPTTSADDRDNPQYIRVTNTLRDTSLKTGRGRYALYRVGGTSAIIKRLDNLYFDDHMSVTTSEGSTNTNLEITLDDADPSYQFKVKWFKFGGASASYRFYNSSSGYIYPYDPAPGTAPIIRSESGETEFQSPNSSGDLVITLDGSNNTHNVDLFVVMRIPGETIEREYVVRCMTHVDGVNVTNANTYDYIDFKDADSLVDIQPIEVDTTPVRNLEGLTESSNLFYAYSGNTLYISEYGNPNSWPETGFLDFDQNITALGTLGSELVVFTEYGMYRVFGSDPSLVKKVQVPTTEGVKAGTSKTIVNFQSGLLFPGHNGICFYNGKSVERITQNILDTFSLPDSTNSNNTGGYFEDTYYLIGASGTGYKLDMKRGAMLSRTTANATSLFYKGSENILYANTGKLAQPIGDRENFTITTRKFDAGDINEEKIYYSVKLTGESFSGTINVLVDGAQTDTFSVSNVTDLDRTFYLTSPRQGNGIQVQLSNCSGIINKIVVNFDSYNALSDSLYESVVIKYIQTPTIAVDIDGVNKITATTLSQPSGVVGEARLYFPAMSNGIVPHLRETNNESSGRVLSYQYSASPV